MAADLRCEIEAKGEVNGKPLFHETITAAGRFQEEWSRKWNKKLLTYAIIRGSDDLPDRIDEDKALSLSLTTWGAEIPIKFKKIKASENPDIRVEFQTSKQNSDFSKRPSVLAFAYFPGQGTVSGKIVFNDDYRWTLHGNPIKVTNPNDTVSNVKTWNLVEVMTHELGHSLGLRHDEHPETKDMMDPFYDGENDELSDWDIIRIRKIYGTRTFGGFWGRYARLKRALLAIKRRFRK